MSQPAVPPLRFFAIVLSPLYLALAWFALRD
jgi:hypothetical protein